MPLALTKELISRRSVTPDDGGCQATIAEYLTDCSFTHETFHHQGVSNSWLRRGTEAPLFVFAGHTDVVPVGNAAAWHSEPFTPTEKDGYLYGRGAADMKGGIAAMVVACKRFVQTHPSHQGSIAILLTSDEEGPAEHGTRYAMEQLSKRNEKIDWCVIGEPSSSQTLGDTIRNGRRGSLTGYLTIKGKQGHVAYADKAINPIHQASPVLKQLCEIQWDQGNDYFPATSFQICKLSADANADNIIPDKLLVTFNFRFSPETSDDKIRHKVEALLGQQPIDYTIDWRLSGQPFLTKSGKLTQTAQEAVYEITRTRTQLSAGGGTSDGRFIAPSGAEVIELGLCNDSIHQVNECVLINDLEQLTQIYQRLMEKLLI